MAFGNHGAISTRNNRRMQNDYKFRANYRKEALKSYLSKAKRSGRLITDNLSTEERAKVRDRIKAMTTKRRTLNVVTLILIVVLLYSMVSYMS